jgi:nitrogen fixation protein FixH
MARKKPLIPPNIGWPLFIIAILSMSVTAATYTFVQANSGGGAQVVDDYYQRALDWDVEKAHRENAERFGWHMALRYDRALENGLRVIELHVTDSTGVGVEEISGTIRAYRPHLSNPIAEVPLQPVGDGRYRQLLPAEAAGLWDFELRASKSGERVFIKRRIDIR